MAEKLKASAASEMEIVLFTLSSLAIIGWPSTFSPLLRAVPNILKAVVSSLHDAVLGFEIEAGP